MANKIYDAFEHVTADSRLKESTMQYLSDKRQKKTRRFALPVQRVLAAACILAVLLLGAGGYSWFLAPVSYVSIDVNPSVELALNKLDRVVSVTAYNKEGKELLEGMSLKGKKYTQAISLIVKSDVLRQYLTPAEDLVLTVASDSSRESSLMAGVGRCSSQIRHGCRSVSVDLDTAADAHSNGLSVGKYSAYLKLAQYDDSVTIDECKNMSMSQIHCRILAHEHSAGHGMESGSGHHGESTEQKPETNEAAQETQTSSAQPETGAREDGHQHNGCHGGH
ncbi:MAG: hypothetical protein K2N87_14075 [Eubacterium sp.]|nr:hypothetical protein [Eubacterium sp.]